MRRACTFAQEQQNRGLRTSQVEWDSMERDGPCCGLYLAMTRRTCNMKLHPISPVLRIGPSLATGNALTMALLQMYVPVDWYKHPLSIENTKRLIPSPGSQDHTCRNPQRPTTNDLKQWGPVQCSQTICHHCVMEHRLKSACSGLHTCMRPYYCAVQLPWKVRAVTRT